MNWSGRLFRLLLLAYPATIREQQGEDMWLTFASHLKDARSNGQLAVIKLWRREIVALWQGGRRARVSIREQVRAHRTRNPLAPNKHLLSGTSLLDFKLGLRMLIKYPGLTLIGGLGMAVAIAISAGSFAFFYSQMYPTLPLHEGERIVALENWDVEVNNEERQSLHDLELWRDQMTSVVEIGAFRTVGRNLILPNSSAEPVGIAEITADGFAVARVTPLLGQPILEQHQHRDAPNVLVIGYDVWQTRFAGDNDVVGQSVRLGDAVHTIIGVMPQGFAFPMNHSFWTPLRADPSHYDRGDGPEVFIFGRLAPGASRDQAQTELTAIGQRSAAAFPATHARLRPQVLPYTYPLIDVQDVEGWQIAVMQFVLSLLLLVVAVNVAVLTYARTATRLGEIAIRSALGASRRRIVVQLFVEALVLAAGASMIGLVLARVGMRLGYRIMEFESAGPPFWTDASLPTLTVAYVVGLTILAAVIVGVLPGIQSTGRAFQSALRRVGTGSGTRLGKTWTGLIIGQVAIAVAALPVAIALAWTQIRLSTIEPTFAIDQVIAGRLLIDEERPPGMDTSEYRLDFANRYTALQNELLARFEVEAGVRDVTFTHSYPGFERRAAIVIEGQTSPNTAQSRHPVRFNQVDIDFFDAFDVPMLAGRGFSAGDTRTAITPIIVNKTFAERLLEAETGALGHRIRYIENGPDPVAGAGGERWHEIVGIVDELHESAVDPNANEPVVYHPLAAEFKTVATLIVIRLEARANPAMTARVREMTTALDPTLRLAGTGTLAAIRGQEEAATRLVAVVVTSVMASVLLLSAAGIYALMSFTVTQRRREIGIRAALGAHPRKILLSIFRRATAQLIIGITLGAGLSAVLLPQAGQELPVHISLVLLAVATIMMLVGLAAALGPARRGLRIQPTEALRQDS